jgi:hypothetical protein
MGRSVTPAPGSIKGIQRGVISMGSGAGSATATITSVDTSKSELRLLGWQHSNNAAPTGQDFPSLVLTNATTVTAARNASGVQTVTVSWELTERY